MFKSALLAAISAISVILALTPLPSAADVVGRDPTKPPGSLNIAPKVVETAGVPRLTSVLIGEDRRLAVIDGRLMYEGEERSGLRVWEILPDRVIVSRAGQQPMTLMLDWAHIHKEVR